jgi:hypothetical protein
MKTLTTAMIMMSACLWSPAGSPAGPPAGPPAGSPVAQDPAPAAAEPRRKVDMGHEIFYATLEGLYVDGVDNGTVDRVLAADDGEWQHFVYGCPTCIYVLEAFRHYRARPDFVSFKHGGNTWGKGLSDAERRAFRSDDLKVRLQALHELVQSWLDRRMDLLRLTDDERRRWGGELRERSKKGMELLRSMQEAGRMKAWGDTDCPSCEGAVAGSMGGR